MSIVSLPVGRRAARSPFGRRSVPRRVTADAVVEARATAPAAAGATLADLRAGDLVQVAAVGDGSDPAVARRLLDLGFTPGAEVRMVRRAPMADPVVFRVAGYDVALRRAQARCIAVVPAS
jgi:Fe2+ transport system protein FeoA